MTITVTVEELQSYQSACEAWVESMTNQKLLEHLGGCEQSGLSMGLYGSGALQAQIRKLAEWREGHPIPKLFPDV